jgi:hypothetical protein
MPPPTMNISGSTPSTSGETGPPVFGRADAEAVELAVAVAVMLAVALMLADALLLADALDMALALDMAEDEALDIIMVSLPICCAIAAGAKADAATMHRAANNRNFLKVPPSVDFPSPGSTCTFPRGSMLGRLQSHRQCTYQDPVVESPTVTLVNR